MNNSYKKLDVYAKSRQLVVTVYSLLKHFPAEEKYALGDQMRRAVISVPSNIAEGLSRTAPKEQAHFFGYCLWFINGNRLSVRYFVGSRLHIQRDARNVRCRN